jgi:hypothetical protein
MGGLRRWMKGWWTFPLLVSLIFATLVGADLNGSSLAILADERPAPSLIAGRPRSIRSDEFYLRTPLAVSSARQGFPRELWIGLARTEQGATAHGGPALEWPILIKPQDWGYVLLGPSRGLAFSWWWSFAMSLLGTYWLLGLVTGRPLIAAGLSVAATFTPYAGWWTSPAPSLFLGYAALGGAAVVAGLRASLSGRAIAFALFAGVLGGALVVALYPPWQVTLAWAVAAITLGLAVDSRVSLRRFVLVAGVSVLVAGALTGAWLLEHRAAISAIASTFYPGQRVYHAGNASLAVLLDAPLNFWMTGSAGLSLGDDGRGGPYANLSENASTWLSVPLIGLLALGAGAIVLRRLQPSVAADADQGDEVGVADGPTKWTLILTLAATLLLLAWSLMPMPDWFGTVTLLERVQPSRTGLALGFAQIVLVAAAIRVRQRPAVWSIPWLMVASVATGALTVWAASQLPWDSALVPAVGVLISGAVLGLLLSLASVPRLAAWAGMALALYAFASWARVNPLQQGIAPLIDDPLPATMHDLAATPSGNDRVVVFGGYDVVADVRGAGLESISGTTLYPDTDLMTRLVPAQRNLWNNYSQYRWRPAPEGTAARIVMIKGTALDLVIDPCDPVLLGAVDPGWVVSEAELEARCLTQVTQAPGRRGATFYIYRYTTQAGLTSPDR